MNFQKNLYHSLPKVSRFRSLRYLTDSRRYETDNPDRQYNSVIASQKVLKQIVATTSVPVCKVYFVYTKYLHANCSDVWCVMLFAEICNADHTSSGQPH